MLFVLLFNIKLNVFEITNNRNKLKENLQKVDDNDDLSLQRLIYNTTRVMKQ